MHHTRTSLLITGSYAFYSNACDDLKAAILQQTRPSAVEQVQKFHQQECIGDLRLTVLLIRMRELAPEESFDAAFWKLVYLKNSRRTYSPS